MNEDIKKKYQHALLALCSQETVAEFAALCSPDITLHLSSGDNIVGISGYLDKLAHVHQSLAQFDRNIVNTVCEATDYGYEIVFHSNNTIASKAQPDHKISFEDFTLIKVNQDGKVTNLWQGPGAHQNLMPLLK